MRQIPPLYHLSFNESLPSILYPQLPAGYDEDSPYREFALPRISFSPTIKKCLQAIYPNVYPLFESEQGQKEGCILTVYQYVPQKAQPDLLFPEDLTNHRYVWDAHITREHCFLEPVTIQYHSTIKIWIDKNDSGLTIYPYNNKNLKPRHNSLFNNATIKKL